MKLKPTRHQSRVPSLANIDHRLGPIEYRSPASLKPYANNPRKHPEKQIVKLMASISKFGFVLPGLNTLARDTLTSKVRVRTPDGEKRMSKMEAVLQKTIELAMKGNPRAIMMLFSLYRPAVPDGPGSESGAGHDHDLTETDLEILNMMRDEVRRELGDAS